MGIVRSLVVVVVALAAAARVLPAQQAKVSDGPQGRWETTLGMDNPLVGKIWDVHGKRFIAPSELAGTLEGDRFVLLGEKHDNPDHHRLQAWIISRMVAAGRRPAVVFEMLTRDMQPAVDLYLEEHPDDAKGLGEAVGWASTGWPAWSMYEGVFAAAVEGHLAIVAGNLDTADTRLLGEKGIAGLDPERVRRLLLDHPLPPAARAALAKEIVESHCGYANEDMIAAMVAVQRGRDASMAERMVSAGADGGAILITGFGHARLDRGVPLYLREREPDATLGSVAFLEVQEGWTEPSAYREEFDGSTLPFNYVWFTPRLDDVDPCEKFRKSLEKLKARGESESERPSPAPTPVG